MSLRQLAEKHEVSLTAIGEQAVRDSWVEAREQFRTEAAQAARVVLLGDAAEDLVTSARMCQAIMTEFMKQLKTGKKSIAAYDAINAGRFREVLEGRADSRTENRELGIEERAKGLGVSVEELEEVLDRLDK